MSNIELLEKTLPAAPLKLIAMESCRELGQKVNDYIVSFRENTINEVSESSLYVTTSQTTISQTAAVPVLAQEKQKDFLKKLSGEQIFSS